MPRPAQPAPSGALGITALAIGVPALVLGLVVPPLFWWVPVLPASVAFVLGVIGASGGRPNRGMAIWGWVCGVLAVIACLYTLYQLNQIVDEFERDLEQIGSAICPGDSIDC